MSLLTQLVPIVALTTSLTLVQSGLVDTELGSLSTTVSLGVSTSLVTTVTPGIRGPSGSGPGSVEWGDIAGTISDQTDLQGAFDAKMDGDVLVQTVTFGDTTHVPSSDAVYGAIYSLRQETGTAFSYLLGQVTGLVVDSLANGDTTHAPSRNAVFDSLTSAQAFSIQRVNHTGTQAQSTVVNLVGDLAAKADLVGGLVPTAQIPSIAVTEYLGAVANQSAMLALSGQMGDWANRVDRGSMWIITGSDPTQLSDWTEIFYPVSAVISVNGQVGAVTLGAADVGADPTGSAAAAQAAAIAAASADATTKANAAQAAAATDATTKANAAQAAAIATASADATTKANAAIVTAAADATTKANAAQTAAQSYADNLVVGLLDDRGSYDASTNLFPSTGGSGSAGAIKKGDLWFVSVGGNLGGVAVTVGDQFRALTDTPGQTAGNWAISEANTGYVPENTANKDTDGTLAANSDTKFASQKAVKTYADTKEGLLSLAASTFRARSSSGAAANKTITDFGLSLVDDVDADTALGTLGGTTVGKNLFKLTNPGAVSFLRINADNTVTAQSLTNFRTDLGLGTAALKDTGTSGDTIPKNNTANTFSTTQTFTVPPVFTDAPGSRDALKIGPRYCQEMYTDFSTNGNFSASGVVGSEWSTFASGTSAGTQQAASSSTTTRLVLALGTTTTGRCAFGTVLSNFKLSYGACQYICKANLVSLSDATDTYLQWLGMMDSVSAEPTNGCYFRYTHSVNGGKWQCVTRAAGVETATDSGITAAAGGTDRVFKVVTDAAAANVYFYVDGTLVQTHITNIPTAAMGFMFGALRSAGTASKSALSADAVYARIDFNTPRWT